MSVIAAPPVLTALSGLAEVADRYDAFILDLWGVIHDGVEAYACAGETLAALKNAGKKTILLSNAPRRAEALQRAMEGMGLPRDLYGDALSSGEATRSALSERSLPFFSRLGERLFHIGPDRDENVYEGLTTSRRVHDMAEADFILNTGPVDLSETLADYTGLLQAGLDRALPMICANPDRVVIRQGQRVMCAGELALWYAGRGGEVFYFGKPDPAIYHECLRRLGMSGMPSRVAVVGDSLETDVAGGAAAGIDVIWCTGGIHAEDLGTRYGQPADPVAATRLAAREGHRPAAIIPGFLW